MCIICNGLINGSMSTYDASLLMIEQSPHHRSEVQVLLTNLVPPLQKSATVELADKSWDDEEAMKSNVSSQYNETAMIYDRYLQASFPFGRTLPDLSDKLREIKDLLVTGISSQYIEGTLLNAHSSGLPLYYIPLDKYGLVLSSANLSVFDRSTAAFEPVIYWNQVSSSVIWMAEHWVESSVPQLIESIVENMELSLLRLLKNI